jgi:hypothetical protein
VIRFRAGERKADVMSPYLQAAAEAGRSKVVAIGCAQEFQYVWTARRRDTDPGMCPQFSFTREQRRVSVFYVYIFDAKMGPGFIKICTYFPYPVKVRVNGHEWAKRQALAAGVGFTELSDGFASCGDPARLQQICDSFGPGTVQAWLDRWMAGKVVNIDSGANGVRVGDVSGEPHAATMTCRVPGLRPGWPAASSCSASMRPSRGMSNKVPAAEADARGWHHETVADPDPNGDQANDADLARPVNVHDVRAWALSLPRTQEHLIRDYVKFRVGRIVYATVSPDETLLGFGFPKEERAALIAAEPERFLLERRSDQRYNWIDARMALLSVAEAREFITEAWRMVIPKRLAAGFSPAQIRGTQST